MQKSPVRQETFVSQFRPDLSRLKAATSSGQ